jgi:hypothetical protein
MRPTSGASPARPRQARAAASSRSATTQIAFSHLADAGFAGVGPPPLSAAGRRVTRPAAGSSEGGSAQPRTRRGLTGETGFPP